MARDERGRREETHQRVVKTRWWSFGPGTSEGGGRGPTNESNDSLVVVWARDERGRGEETHQRAIKTRWWSFGPGTSEGGGKNHPTSRNDSLGVAWPGTSEGGERRPTNES